ncbi:hypothetical protein MNBD_GAMMA21-1992 [hydrothermal vent metagenome]|uniref:DUF3379 domain-containing protein n=1 Tax=hydrothermal vent metagenome TaxID=652676 RepID=A0A3B1AMV4_9ZZZZ
MSDNEDRPLSDGELHDLLARPSAPQHLQKKLLKNLVEQVSSEQASIRQTRWRFGLALSFSVNIVLLILIISLPFDNQSTALMNMVSAHVEHEKELDGNFISDHISSLEANGIHSPPSTYKIELRKNCLIGLEHVEHIRVKNQQKKNINLLIFVQPKSKDLPATVTGTRGLQSWIKVKISTDVSVIAFFDNDVSINEVRYLVDTMFQKNSAMVKSLQRRLL